MADDNTTPGTDGAPNDGAGEQAPAPQAGQTPPTPDQAPAQKVEDLPDWAQTLVRDLRAENASARTNAKQTAAQEARDSIATEIGKALGLIKDDAGAPSVDDLTNQVKASNDAARQAQIELAVYRGATQHDGDPAALLDSRAFLAKVTDLDPTSTDFTTKIGEAIKEQVDTNPKLKASGPAPSRSGGEMGGKQEQPTGQSPAELAALIRKNRIY
jgi:hypothetical protein